MKKAIPFLLTSTILLSACGQGQASDIQSPAEEVSIQEESSAVASSVDEVVSASTEATSEEKSEDVEAETDNTSEDSINEFFFSNISDEHVYDVTEFLYEDIDSVSIDVSLVSNFTNGNVYSITIDYEDCPGRYYWGISDRFDLGLFYVTDEEIYMVNPSVDDISSEEEFLSKGVLVCSANDSDETVDGEHRRIVNEGDSCTFYSSNTLTESGFYYSYTWTKGKGLSFYRSGYGAEGDPIEITLK